MNRLKLCAVGLAAGLALVAASFVTGACSAAGPVDYPYPPTWTVSYLGQTYCPYEYDPREFETYGYVGTCARVPFPSVSVVPVPGTLEAALMVHWTTYSGFYESGFWYDQYYAPIGARYHVSVISRTSYMSNVSTFEHTYAGQIKNNSAKARWSNGKTGNYQFPSSNQKARNKPLTNTGSNSGSSNYGTSNSRDRSGPATNTSGSKTGSGSSSTSSSGGKPGTRR